MANSVKEIKDYFGTEGNPVGASEFMEFWKSCSDEDKEYYKEASLA